MSESTRYDTHYPVLLKKMSDRLKDSQENKICNTSVVNLKKFFIKDNIYNIRQKSIFNTRKTEGLKRYRRS